MNLLRIVLLPIGVNVFDFRIRRIYVLLIWDREFCRCLLGPLDPELNSCPEYPFEITVLLI